MSFFNCDPLPWPPATYPIWYSSPILPREATCNHCYCAEGEGGLYRKEGVKHLKCCKCGDEMAERFLTHGPEKEP